MCSMHILTDKASKQLSQGVSAIANGLLGTTIVLFLAVLVHAPVAWVISDSPAVVTVWEWLQTDQTPAYLISSALVVLLLSVESKLSGATDATNDEPDDQSESNGLGEDLVNTFNLIMSLNIIILEILAGVFVGVVISQTSAAPLALAAAFVYPLVDIRIAQKAERIPTPVQLVAVFSAPFAAVPTLYTVPLHLGGIVSKRFGGILSKLLTLTGRATGVVLESFQLPTQLFSRRRS